MSEGSASHPMDHEDRDAEGDDEWKPDSFPFRSYVSQTGDAYSDELTFVIDRFIRHEADEHPCPCGCRLCHQHPAESSHSTPFERKWSISMMDLEESAKACNICSLLWQAALFARRDAGMTSPSFELSVKLKPHHGGLLSLVYPPTDESEGNATIFEFYRLGEGPEPPWLGVPWRPEVTGPSLPNLSTSIAWVQKQIATCNQHHECYDATQTEHFLPKRVLDLGGPNTPLENGIRLYESAVNERGTWATLSHCWGATHHICTERESLEDHKRRIKWSEIPPTYKNAIEIARELEMRYLWIDSLCIIQDDPNDWRIEAAKMADIYRQSYVTIAATNAKDGDSGILKPESFSKTLKLTPQSPNVRGVPGEIGPVYVRRVPNHDVFSVTDKIKEPRLLTRAWVYQERVLSPRVIHFCDDDLVWECERELLCQCGYVQHAFNRPATVKNGVRSPVAGGKFMTDQSLTISSNVARPPPNASISLKASFRDRISDYGRLNITKATDRLPAFAGIARQYSRDGWKTYIAGLWADTFDLAQDLTWQASGRKLTLEELSSKEVYVAPTWSWASLPSSHYNMYRSDKVTPIFFLRDWDIKHKGEDVYGECMSGHLVLESILREVKLTIKTGGKWNVGGEGERVWVGIPQISPMAIEMDFRIEYRHFTPLPLPQEGDSSSISLPSPDNHTDGDWFESQWAQAQQMKEATSEDIAIAESKETFTVFLLSSYAALLLRKVRPDEYVRVGIAVELDGVNKWLNSGNNEFWDKSSFKHVRIV